MQSTRPHENDKDSSNEVHLKKKRKTEVELKSFTSFKTILRNITSSRCEAIKFLQSKNVLQSSMKCPGPLVEMHRVDCCGEEMTMKKTSDRSDGYVWRCRKVHTYSKGNKTYKCKDVKVTLRENSWLLDAKLPLESCLEFIYLWSQGFDTLTLQHELKLCNKTVIEWSAYLREICMNIVMDSSCKIGGPGIEVEIDESKFGKHKYYRGHRVEGQWVFGGREKNNTSKVFMVPVHNRKRKTLLPIIKHWIAKGSVIHSDCWKAYSSLSKEGYKHVTVNHSKEFKNESTGACTNSIESDWRHAKVSMPRYGVHKGFHAGYLAEFMWRRKYQDHDKFLTLLEHITNVYNKSLIAPFPV